MRTSQDIVDQTIEVARIIYGSRGYVTDPGFKFWKSKHPHELQAWDAACQIQEFLTGTDVEDCLIDIGEYE